MSLIEDVENSEENRLFKELAAIFAAALVRLRRRLDFDENELPGKEATCLEVPSETEPNGQDG